MFSHSSSQNIPEFMYLWILHCWKDLIHTRERGQFVVVHAQPLLQESSCWLVCLLVIISDMILSFAFSRNLPELESPRDVYLVFQPLAHIYGCNILVASIVAGARLVVMPTFNLRAYVELVSKYKVCIVWNFTQLYSAQTYSIICYIVGVHMFLKLGLYLPP